MKDLELFIVNSHQVFFALLGLAFCFFLFLDLDKLKESSGANRRQFYTAIIFITGVGLSFAFMDSWQGRGLWFGVEFGLLCSLCLVSPKYAASFFLFLLLVRPWETFNNQLMESMPRDVFYLCMISLIGHKLANRRFYFRANFSTVMVIAFAVWLFMSGFLSSHFSEAMKNYNEIFSKGVMVFLLLQNSFEKPSDLLPAKAALALAIIELGIISAYSTYIKSLGSIVNDEFQRLETVGILGNSNDIAAILVLAAPFCFFFFLRTKIKILSEMLALASFGAVTYLVWSTQSRGALLALFAGVGALMFTKLKTKKSMIIVASTVIIGALISFSFLQRKGADLDGSTDNRIIYWKAGLNMAVRNPLFGVGFWGYNRNLPMYAVGGNLGSEGKYMTAHSSWVQVLSENGFMGLFLFLGLWAYGIKHAWRVRSRSPEYFVALAGYGTAITFLSHAYLLYPYIILGLSITHSFLETDERITLEKQYINGELAWQS
ncbi:MAG: O-antigen ligase family protein [Bacteriovoracaceae bacterium]|nr:O-antigen ligase family protein [Bacteriovoracaceae bacterium]